MSFGWTQNLCSVTVLNQVMNIFSVKPALCRHLLAALAAAILLAGLIPARAQTEERKPAPRRASIILIVADDLGYGDLGCYGNTKIKTPNLDKLAAEGVRFTSFYGGGATGSESRAALLTGRDAVHLGSGENLLPPDATTISQMLKNAGYRTGFLGQWGLGGLPENKSFDQVGACLEEQEQFDHYPSKMWRADNVLNYSGAEMQFSQNDNNLKGTYFPDLFTHAAANFVADNKPERFNQYRSFFLCLSYNVPHAKLDLTDTGDYLTENWPAANKEKAAMITRLDTEVGVILQRLNSSHQTNNVMVIFTSGNGPDTNAVDPNFLNSAGGLRGARGGLYEGGIRVPMIVWFPRMIKPAVISRSLANWDILPTLADVAWTKPPENIDGVSFWPLLTGQKQTNTQEFLYWENAVTGARAVRMGDWKAVRPAAGEPLELYDLKTDSHEKDNVAAKNPAVVAKIEGYLKTVRP